MKVVLDANALMMPFIYRINIDIEIFNLMGEVEFYVPSSVVGEIKRLSERRWEAKAAMELMRKYRVVNVSKLGDDGVLEAAKKLNGYLLTNDEELRRRAKKDKIKVIFMKQNHLVMDDD